MEVCRLLRPISFHPSRSRDLERSAAALQFSGARGLSCCSPTSFSSARVSASFTQHTSTPVPLPRARQRSKIRSGLPFCHKRSVRALMSLPQEQIEARDDREVKLPTARRQRIEYHYDLLREWRGSRGRHGAGDASVDASLACARLWACLGSARPTARLPPPPPPLRPCTQWPLLERRHPRQRASSSVSARPCGRARPAGHPGRSASTCTGRAREHKMCNVVARRGPSEWWDI